MDLVHYLVRGGGRGRAADLSPHPGEGANYNRTAGAFTPDPALSQPLATKAAWGAASPPGAETCETRGTRAPAGGTCGGAAAATAAATTTPSAGVGGLCARGGPLQAALPPAAPRPCAGTAAKSAGSRSSAHTSAGGTCGASNSVLASSVEPTDPID